MLRFPNESPEYRDARARLLDQEIALRRQMESVAAARRALPAGGAVPEDYAFEEMGEAGEPLPVRLSELFSRSKGSLAIYSMMFPRGPSDDRPGAATGETARLPLAEAPCPSCTALIDQLEGAAVHVAPHLDLVIVAKAPIARVATFAKERGWRRLRVLSSEGCAYNRDYHAEDDAGAQLPMLNVFTRDGALVRHFWGSELLHAPSDPGQDPRHVGTIEPMWNLFDLTREGRGADWDEQLQYAPRPARGHCERC